MGTGGNPARQASIGEYAGANQVVLTALASRAANGILAGARAH